jgi:hypothetical protein
MQAIHSVKISSPKNKTSVGYIYMPPFDYLILMEAIIFEVKNTKNMKQTHTRVTVSCVMVFQIQKITVLVTKWASTEDTKNYEHWLYSHTCKLLCIYTPFIYIHIRRSVLTESLYNTSKFMILMYECTIVRCSNNVRISGRKGLVHWI